MLEAIEAKQVLATIGLLVLDFLDASNIGKEIGLRLWLALWFLCSK
jgi:hypothetical protein